MPSDAIPSAMRCTAKMFNSTWRHFKSTERTETQGRAEHKYLVAHSLVEMLKIILWNHNGCTDVQGDASGRGTFHSTTTTAQWHSLPPSKHYWMIDLF